MLYSVAIAITRLIEAGTVRRLQITRMTSFDLLTMLIVLSALYFAVGVWLFQRLHLKAQ
jgi:hypothetical protein